MTKRALLHIFALLALAIEAPAASAYYSGQPTPGNPLAGHPWFVDMARGSWFVALRADPAAATPLRPVAINPMGKTFASFITDPRSYVAGYIQRAQSEEPGSIPFLNPARLENQSCPYRSISAGFSEGQIDSWVNAFAQGTVRTGATASDDRRPAAEADVAEAQGFVLGASHHDWTSAEVRFGLQISRRLHGKHFVVNTNETAGGPKGHATSWYARDYHPGCVPPGEGIGSRPTVRTGDPHIDAFLWMGVPGFEGGDCLGYGANSPYTFCVRLAASLVQNANPPISNGQN